MSDFDERLKSAINRGQQHSAVQAEREKQQQISEDELRRKHSEIRLKISEQIEQVLKKVVDHLPGFEYETVYGDRGWGGAISRDDVQITNGRRQTLFSRLEITVRPYSEFHVVDLISKGTARNQEVFLRNFHERIEEVDLDRFLNAVDQWALDYAEEYSNR